MIEIMVELVMYFMIGFGFGLVSSLVVAGLVFVFVRWRVKHD